MNTPSERTCGPRSHHVQSGNRQQAAGLRSRQPARARHHPWKPSTLPNLVIQRKARQPVQFELTEPTRTAVSAWFEKSHRRGNQSPFPSRVARSPHLSTRQYVRIAHHWAEATGLDSSAYGTHSMRRTKATLIYKRTKNLRAVQLLLAIPNWKAPSDILASRGTTHRRFQSRLKFNQHLTAAHHPHGRFLASCRMRAVGQEQKFDDSRKLPSERPLHFATCPKGNSGSSAFSVGFAAINPYPTRSPSKSAAASLFPVPSSQCIPHHRSCRYAGNL